MDDKIQNVSSAELTIAYDGEMVRTGVMDVQELAPALLATGTLLQKANRLINGEQTHISLKVRSDFKHGSFIVHLLVDQGFLEQAKNFLLRHPGITEAKDILDIVFFFGGIPLGLFKLIKFLGQKKPDNVTFENNGETVNIALGDQHVTVNKNTYHLYQDPGARRAAGQIVAPLNREGVDTLEIRRGNAIETVGKDEAAAFEYSGIEGDRLIDTVGQAWLAIIALSFKPDNKWRFSNGGITITALVADESFWQKVHMHTVKFAEGDQLLVELRTTTSRDEKGQLHSNYVVERVVEHLPLPRQTSFDL